jgi:formylglycine-generating enzyme required for sulfatase activity
MVGTALENLSIWCYRGDTCPVEQVSWDQVQVFLSRQNARSPGKHFRLPTEAEWEYAARAGEAWDYNVAGRAVEALGWIGTNANGTTHAVGQKLPNAWGLYDMHGNPWEWVNHWYVGNERGAVSDPAGRTTGSLRVLRGGSWYNPARLARVSFRFISPPSNRQYIYGFRLARTP